MALLVAGIIERPAQPFNLRLLWGLDRPADCRLLPTAAVDMETKCHALRRLLQILLHKSFLMIQHSSIICHT